VTLRPLVASLLAFSLAASAQGLPDLGDASTASLSEAQERTIGNRVMREIRNDPMYLDDPEIASYIKALGARLLLAAEGARRDLEFFAINDDQVNAFALVGGHIGVNSGLITLTQNESELAGVLAHEISHITQRHQARAMHGQRGTQLASLAALAIAILASSKGGGGSQSGQVTEAAIMGASAMAAQAQLDYTRDHEREADRVGLQLLDRSGLDTRGMVTFFERLLRANRLNEFKGAPSYLRTHPLTTERIADMQDRVERLPTRMVPDSFDYRLVRAKIRAMSGAPQEAVNYFTTQLADKTVLRPREEVYGLAYSQRRARDLEGAWKTLAPLRENITSNPAFELLAAQIRADQGRVDDAFAIYRAALKASTQSRALVYGYLDLLVQRGRSKEALADLEERLRYVNDDPRLYELQARAYESSGQRLAQHRSQAEAYYRRGNLASAVDQLELAVKFRNANFYELSSAESRLREMRVLLENERAAEKAMKIS
jgi:predicted Zn-dependent protease